MVKHCSAEGGRSLLSFAVAIGVSRDTLHSWGQTYPEFAEAIVRAKEIAEAKLAQIGFEGMTGKRKFFRSSIWEFWMGARFGWNAQNGPQDIEDDQLLFR